VTLFVLVWRSDSIPLGRSEQRLGYRLSGDARVVEVEDRDVVTTTQDHPFWHNTDRKGGCGSLLASRLGSPISRGWS
jgi:hypothetical protein